MLFIKKNFKTITLLVIFVLVVISASAVSFNDKVGWATFAMPNNIRTLFMNMTSSGVMMVGMACLLMSGSIDLSTDSQAILGTVMFVNLIKALPSVPWGFLFVMSCVLMVAIALLHSFLTNVLGFMPFIATIGTSSIYTGLASIWTKAADVAFSRPSFQALSKLDLKLFTVTTGTGREMTFVIPFLFLVTAFIIIVYALMLTQTQFGRKIYLVGGNMQAARLAGINPKKISTALMINNSILALVGGLMWVLRNNKASITMALSMPSMGGMTAAILGGVSFMGGGATGLGGAFVGLLLINTFTFSLEYYPGLNSQKWDWLQIMLGGLILVIALVFDTLSSRSQMKKLLEARRKIVVESAEAGKARLAKGV
jgi:ribose/xylose/arabinose/galactoside ABC-type transport system permease subunit